MDSLVTATDFYDALPRLATFGTLADPGSYTPLPDDWVIGCADIVGSTRAIAEGQYKKVNMAGAAVISAQINLMGGRDFPFIFGGDGAAFAVGPEDAARSAEALAAVQAWTRAECGLELRVAQVPVSTIRAAGRDVLVARYSASADVDYAMFAGGGLSWAEARMKAGDFAVPAAPPGQLPDLSGLSCRWAQIRARNGVILSAVIRPAPGAGSTAFARVTEKVLAIAHRIDRDGHPLPAAGAEVGWPPSGLGLEVLASRGSVPAWKRRLQLLAETLVAWFFLRTGLPVGGFDPAEYRRAVARNADFRKFDDGLKMTLDVDPATVEDLRGVLEQAQADGIVEFGLFQQEEAMMTCIVPSPRQGNHVHFIDGASGGYTQAAAQIKRAATA